MMKKFKKFCINHKKLIIALIALFLAGCIGLSVFAIILMKDLPTPDQLIKREVAQSTKIYDRTGKTVLYEIYGNQKRTLVSLADIPDYVKNATVAIEDKDFYKHKGISIRAIIRTIVMNVLKRQRAGGSTLTQQFVKNAILSPEKTYTRKIKEWILAYRMEKKFKKDEILQMYLNEIPYGSTAYGIEAASLKYFGKSVKDISLAEAATLAALPQAPSRYSPYGPNKDLLLARQEYILKIMKEQGYITQEEMESAMNAKIEFRSQQENNITAPHFIMYVKELLAEKLGDRFVEQGGLKITTTLDLNKQQKAEEAIRKHSAENVRKYNAWNASLVSIDPKTGQIQAMVGSKDYFGRSEPENCISGKNCKFEPNDNVALRTRQPGSSIKPLVYATAFMRGFTPNTILYDVATNFSTTDKPYEPKNYNLNSYGPVSMKKALAGSLNVPAVKTLYLAGLDNVIDIAKDLGYTTLNDKERLGLTLVLGGGEVKLTEHTNAFSAFARSGDISPLSAIIKVEDSNGNILDEYKDSSKKVYDSRTASEINDILSDNSARSYIFSSSNWLTIGKRQVAAKTGTTNDNRDAWTIGYTPSLVAGVWVGNNDFSEMSRGADGSVVAAPIWHDYMKNVLGDTDQETFKEPISNFTGKAVLDGKNVGEVKVKTDKASGFLATEFTPQNYIEEKTFAQHHCILYHVDKNDPKGDTPKNPEKDPQFNLWESAVQRWAQKQGAETSTPPTAFDNLHTPENKPALNIISPADNSEVSSALLKISLAAIANRGVKTVDMLLDGQLKNTLTQEPYELFYDLSGVSNGYHDLSFKACDDIENCISQKISINVKISQESANAGKIPLLWLEPKSGIAVSDLDFPLVLKMETEEYYKIKMIELYFSDTSNNITGLIATLDQITDKTLSTAWNSVPESGTYKVYALAYDQNDIISRSPDNLVIVNKIQK